MESHTGWRSRDEWRRGIRRRFLSLAFLVSLLVGSHLRKFWWSCSGSDIHHLGDCRYHVPIVI